MNYIYDIYLNLNNVLIDFFEWNKCDKLIHIKKIPIIKLHHEDFIKFNSYSTCVNEKFLSDIYNKTELWSTNEKLDYCVLFCDEENIIAVEFDSKGNSIKKSYLQIDEELEILEIVNKYKEKCIDFNILKKENCIFKTRKELIDEKFIEKELNNTDIERLKYIYFECFDKHENNKNVIIKDINKISKTSKAYKNLYNILKLTQNSKNKI